MSDSDSSSSTDSSEERRKRAAQLRKGRRTKSCVMPEKKTLKGSGCMLSDMKGADDVFGLENRYKAYAADRRKVLSKKDALSMSQSDHVPRTSTLVFAGEDLMKRKTLEHGSFFEYRNKPLSKTSTTGNETRSSTSSRRKVPLRAKSLDLEDAAALARAMTAIRRNDDSSSSGKSFDDDSSDSSFTASLCSYSKEMAAKTNVFDRSKRSNKGKDAEPDKQIMTMQIDVDAEGSAAATTNSDSDAINSDLDNDDEPAQQPAPAPVRRKVPSRTKSLDRLDIKVKPQKMATANEVTKSSSKRSSSTKEKVTKGKSKEMDESKKGKSKDIGESKLGSKDKKASKKKKDKKESSSKANKKESSSSSKTTKKEGTSKSKSKSKESKAKE